MKTEAKSMAEAYYVLNDATIKQRLQERLKPHSQLKTLNDASCLIFDFEGDDLEKAPYSQINVHGYGMCKAHRVALTLKLQGPIKHCALHACDIRPCIQPAHLWDGTQQDNIADMVAKKRHTHGEKQSGVNNGRAKLEEAHVTEIRRLHVNEGYTAKQLKSLLNSSVGISVDISVINDILNGATWKFTDGPVSPKLDSSKQGSSNPNSSITEETAVQIREMYATGKWTQSSLARHLKLSGGVVRRIVTAESWKHLGPPVKPYFL